MPPLVLLSWLVASTPSEAQTPAGDTATMPAAAPAPDDAPRPVDEFLLILKSGERIEGNSGSLTANRFTGLAKDGKRLELLPNDIESIYRKDGSRAGTMALYGAGVGLAISGISIIRASASDPTLFHTDFGVRLSAGVIGGGTALGALIGLAVGAAQTRWSVEPLVAPGQRYALLLSHPL